MVFFARRLELGVDMEGSVLIVRSVVETALGKFDRPWPPFLFLDDFRFEVVDVLGGSLEGPAESLRDS